MTIPYYHFRVYGEPKAQPRAKATVIGNHARVYNPNTAKDWKTSIKAAVANQIEKTLEGPIALRVLFFFPRPLSHFGTGKNSGTLKPSAPVHHTTKPDLDNLLKALKDALTDIGLWRDDKQVVDVKMRKLYVDSPKDQGAEVIILPAGEG